MGTWGGLLRGSVGSGVGWEEGRGSQVGSKCAKAAVVSGSSTLWDFGAESNLQALPSQ